MAKQVARYFFISTSEPGSSFRDRCVRCLKALVSTMFRLAEPWFSADDGEESCSKNLYKKNIKHPPTVFRKLLSQVETGETKLTSFWEIFSHLGFSLLCSERHCSNRSMNFWGKAVKSIRRFCWTFRLFKLFLKKQVWEILITLSQYKVVQLQFSDYSLKNSHKAKTA